MIHVALAAYNEEKNIGALLAGLERVMPSCPEPVQVVIVDDGSTDRTSEVVRSHRGRLNIHLVRQENAGFLKALARALKEALAAAEDDDVCVTMDADNTHPTEVIPELARRVRAGSDVVIASRFQKGGGMVGVPFHRTALSVGARLVMGLCVPIRNVRDYSTSYRGYRAGLLKRAFGAYGDRLLEGKGFSGMAAFLVRLSHLAARIDEAPLLLRYDLKQNDSKMNIGKTAAGYLELIWGNWAGKYHPRTQAHKTQVTRRTQEHKT